MPATTLKDLYAELESHVDQLPLAEKPSDIIPGEGKPDADIMFIGEAPGYYESVQRRPFVGKSGQLFRQVLRDVGIEEMDVYISNIVKVRPPDNRDPFPDEIKAFRPYLDAEIELIKPKLIVTLGRFSMAKFLPEVKVSQVHGRLHKVKWRERLLFVLPMYHPAAALRAPKVKESFIQDFQKLPKILNWINEHESDLVFQQTVAETLA